MTHSDLSQDSDTGPIVVKIPDAMRMLSASRSRLYELMDEGELESIKDGKSRKITTDSIRAYVARKLLAARAAA